MIWWFIILCLLCLAGATLLVAAVYMIKKITG